MVVVEDAPKARATGNLASCPAARQDLQHIRVRSCVQPNIIELFGSQLTTAGDAAVMTMRAIIWLSG